MRELIRQQQESDRQIETWAQMLGERLEGQAGFVPIETLRSTTLATLAHLNRREEPVSMEELARLSLVLSRIEGADKRRLERECAVAKAAAERRRANGQGGLSSEAVAIIGAEVEGRPRPPARTVTSVPVDPWDPEESRPSHLIPADPAKMNGALPGTNGKAGPQRDREWGT